MLFASDLDNTLIHSFKKTKKGDVCVEYKDGKEVSFMPYEGHQLLKKIVTKCEFVPVTTRSLEQYRRIDLGIVPKYAIVDNGAILLIDGKVDKEWLAETEKLIEIKLPSIVENDLFTQIRHVDDFFIFLKSDNPTEALIYLESFICKQNFMICAIRNKVYVIPKKLNKGLAIDRLCKRLGKTFVISSGDSKLDISMLEKANIAICPHSLELKNKNQIILKEELFSIHMLKNVNKLIEDKNFIDIYNIKVK